MLVTANLQCDYFFIICNLKLHISRSAADLPLFLIANNLDLFRKNIELVSEINFTTSLLIEFKQKLIDYLLSKDFLDVHKIKSDIFDNKFKDLIDLVNTNAIVKIIAKNKSEDEIIGIFNEIADELKAINLRDKIQYLEDKVSLNLDEKLYSELLSLRNQLKGG